MSSILLAPSIIFSVGYGSYIVLSISSAPSIILKALSILFKVIQDWLVSLSGLEIICMDIILDIAYINVL